MTVDKPNSARRTLVTKMIYCGRKDIQYEKQKKNNDFYKN